MEIRSNLDELDEPVNDHGNDRHYDHHRDGIRNTVVHVHGEERLLLLTLHNCTSKFNISLSQFFAANCAHVAPYFHGNHHASSALLALGNAGGCAGFRLRGWRCGETSVLSFALSSVWYGTKNTACIQCVNETTAPSLYQ